MKRTGQRTGAAARSGPKVQRAARKRRPVELTLSPGALDALAALAAEMCESRSAVVEALVIGRVAEDVLSPVVLEHVSRVAAETGQTAEAVLDDLAIEGLRALGAWK